MTIAAIIILIVLGIILLLLEFLVIPGVTVAGIGGVILMGIGVFFSFKSYGNLSGFLTLFFTLVFIIIALVFSLKAGTWKRLSLNTAIDSKVNVISEHTQIKLGIQGKTISRLAPIGKVLIDNEFYEAKALNQFIDENTEVVVIKVLGNQLIVESVEKPSV